MIQAWKWRTGRERRPDRVCTVGEVGKGTAGTAAGPGTEEGSRTDGRTGSSGKSSAGFKRSIVTVTGFSLFKITNVFGDLLKTGYGPS